MKQTSRIVLVVLTLAVVLFARLGPAYAMRMADASSSSSQFTELTFTGTIEKLDGNQWVVAGKTVSMDPLLAASGKFSVGDTVKVEGIVQADGSVSAKSVELPSGADDNSNNSNDSSVDNGNGNSNENEVGDNHGNGNSNETEIGDDHGNDNGNSNVNDDHSGSNSNKSHDDKSGHDKGHDDNSNSSNDNSGNDDSSSDDNSNNG